MQRKETQVLKKASASEDNIWKALSDPTRREILDTIRTRPKTTGALVEKFEHLSRFAVMKHLNVLEEAKLISIRREGKYRLNHINAIPIQEIYERWVKKYEVQWASGLLQLKELTEYKSNIDHITKQLIMEQSQVTRIQMEISINASIEHTWQSMINDIGLWWRKDFYTSPKTKEFILEARPGGKMYEDYGNNEGLVWAEVIILDSPNILELKSHLSPAYGGPVFSFLRLALESSDEGTTLKLSDVGVGTMSDEAVKQAEAGWRMLFEDGFKSYVESKN
ncbi:MAG: helix-turn-helix domain-containing protein [Cyclobacteriaceae bacterium]